MNRPPDSSGRPARPEGEIDDREIEDLLRQVGAYQLTGYRALEKESVAVKDDAGHGISVVTEFDRETEGRVKAFLEERFPRDSFLGEELGNVKRDPRRYWILDPIDGTSNFTQGIPFWGPSLALWDEHGPARGWIYFPALDEMYRARRGGGAFRDGTPLKASTVSEYSNLCTVATVSRMHRRYRLTCPAKHRILGSVVANFCWLASGSFAAMYCRASIWDLAAGLVLAREAGAVLDCEPALELADPSIVDPKHAPSIAVYGMANSKLPSLKKFLEPLEKPVEGR